IFKNTKREARLTTNPRTSSINIITESLEEDTEVFFFMYSLYGFCKMVAISFKVYYGKYMVRVAINGYGRIGRVAHRIIIERFSSELEVVAVNAGSSTDIEGWMYLL